jgi:hypothetical protein
VKDYQDVFLIFFSISSDAINDNDLSTHWTLTVLLEVCLHVSFEILEFATLKKTVGDFIFEITI